MVLRTRRVGIDVEEVTKGCLLAGASLLIIAAQVWVVYVAYNILATRFSWPPLSFLESGALWALAATLLRTGVQVKKND